jgi:hypothetical protein
MLVLITILTSLTTIAAYAGEDGNKQKAEDDSSATLDDCDDNEVEQAGFDCLAIATNDVVIEPPEESATLFVCKEVEGNQELIPSDFEFSQIICIVC